MIRSLLNANGTLAPWITESFPIIQTILLILISICAVTIIVVVLLQQSNPEGGANAITGTNESYYSMNKGGNKEGRLQKIIIISSILILVFAILYFISLGIYNLGSV